LLVATTPLPNNISSRKLHDEEGKQATKPKICRVEYKVLFFVTTEIALCVEITQQKKSGEHTRASKRDFNRVEQGQISCRNLFQVPIAQTCDMLREAIYDNVSAVFSTDQNTKKH